MTNKYCGGGTISVKANVFPAYCTQFGCRVPIYNNLLLLYIYISSTYYIIILYNIICTFVRSPFATWEKITFNLCTQNKTTMHLICFSWVSLTYTHYNFKIIYSKIIWTLVGRRDAMIMTYRYTCCCTHASWECVCVFVSILEEKLSRFACGLPSYGVKWQLARNEITKTKPLYGFFVVVFYAILPGHTTYEKIGVKKNFYNCSSFRVSRLISSKKK